MSRLRNLALMGMLLFCIPASSVAQQSTDAGVKPAVPAQYAATAIGQAGTTAGRTFGLNIYMDKLTASGEVDEMLGILQQKGQDGLVRAMEDMKDVGRVAPTGSVGTGLKVVRVRARKNGGQHIVLVTNRPISFAELYNFTRSTDYPFSFVVLDLDKDGKGTGLLAPLCKLKFNKKKELEIEHYGQKPFRLANVYRP
jgi:hypothetical protein